MQIQFATDERQFINLCITDAMNGAERAGNREVFREGKRLKNQFAGNSATTNVSMKELTVIRGLVENSLEVLEKQVGNLKYDQDTITTNLECARRTLESLDKIMED